MSYEEIDGIDPTQGPNSQQPQPPVDPSTGQAGQAGGPSSSSDAYSTASTNFFPSMPMTQGEFKHFMSNLLNLISTEIQNDRDKMKEASDKLKQSESGDDQS